MPRIFLRLPSPTTDWANSRSSSGLLPLLRSPRLLLLLALSLLLLGTCVTIWSHFSPPGTTFTDTSPISYSYGVVIDAGSSSSKVQLYRWPPHDGDPAKLLDIEPLRDEYGLPLKKKVEPGIATYILNQDEAYQSLVPLLDFALSHIPEPKWVQTSLYVLCTAGMRLLEERDQASILGHLSHRIAQEYSFHLPQDSIQVISGQMEGVFSWLTINYLLRRFDPEFHHNMSGKGSGDSGPPVNTVGSVDMGGASLQIAFEVPLNVETSSSHTVDINLGCGIQNAKHKHRVYIDTYLGYGSNEAIRLYHKMLALTHKNSSTFTTLQDPCSPLDMYEDVTVEDRTLSLHGSGDFDSCRAALLPVLLGNATQSPCVDRTCRVASSFKRPAVKYQLLEFLGTSEFFYTTRDVLRMAGSYDADSFERSAKEYCRMQWSVLEERYQKKLYPYADFHRLKSQCAKSAWMSLVLHDGLGFPRHSTRLTTTAEISRHNVHWSLGALLYLTRYLPLREIQLQQQAQLQSVSPSAWATSPSLVSSLTESSFTLPCLVVVVVALILLVCRHRRPRSSHCGTSYSYCGLSGKSGPVELLELPLVHSDSQLSMSRNLSSRKLSMAIP